MKQPKRAQFFRRDPYWEEVEKLRTKSGLPKWSFDFISIHPHGEKEYRLISPLCLVDDKTGQRPDFEESRRFSRKSEAIKGAKEIARNIANHIIFVVDCACTASREA